MKNISGKRLFMLLGLFVLFSPLLRANGEVSEADIESFIDYLMCDFNVLISEADLELALDGLIDLEAVGCDPIEPELLSMSSSTAYFEWVPSANAVDYTVASIGLSGGLPFQDVTSNTKYTFTGLTPQQYLFIFIANCLDGPSVASVIIADLDVYMPSTNYSVLSDCSCPFRGEQTVYPTAPCSFYANAETYEWSNYSCDAKKYKFTISGYGGSSDSEEVWILNNTVGGEVNLSAFDCSEFIVPIGETEDFTVSDPGNFEVVLSTIGAHFYMENTNLSIDAVKCGCYNGLQTNDGQGKLQLITNEPFEVSPNPFLDRISIKANAKSDGEAIISIIGLDGKIVQTEKRTVRNGPQSIAIDTGELPKGVYSLLFECGDQRNIEKLVKI